MSEFFTIDARGTLHEGLIVQTEAVDAVLGPVDPVVLEGARALCPQGVSAHGRLHVLELPADGEAYADAYAEVLLELARRAGAREAPSRLSSLFAFTTPEDARAFAAARRRPDAAVYLVKSDAAFVGDQHWVGLGSTPLLSAVYARRYWTGDPHPLDEPLWEALIPLPVTIGPMIG